MEMNYKITMKDLEVAEKNIKKINNPLYIKFSNSLILGAFFSGVTFIFNKNIIIISLVGFATFLWIYFITSNLVYKRLARLKYKYHKSYYDKIHSCEFCENSLLITSDGEKVKINFENSISSYEDKNRYVIYLSKENYFIVNKTNYDGDIKLTDFYKSID